MLEYIDETLIYSCYLVQMKMVIIVALMLALMPHMVHGLSGGAPDEACANVSPNPTQHLAEPQAGDNPFNLTIEGDPTSYIPDMKYTSKFSAHTLQ